MAGGWEKALGNGHFSHNDLSDDDHSYGTALKVRTAGLSGCKCIDTVGTFCKKDSGVHLQVLYTSRSGEIVCAVCLQEGRDSCVPERRADLNAV